MNVIQLTPLDLSLAAVLVLILAALSRMLHLGVGRQLIIAALRTTIQLLLVGMVLKALFANTSLVLLGTVSLAMLLMAGREVMARQKHRFQGWWGFGLGTLSMFISSFAVTVLALTVVINNQPWYMPQYAIPLLGMLLGNTMNGVSLGLDLLTRNTWEQRDVIEQRLLLGGSWSEVVADIRREAMRVGLTPVINAMAAAGIISLPGMMTGQILAGAPPVVAVNYQILIMFLIAAGTGFGTMVAVSIGARRLFDQRHRLCLDRLN